MRRSISIFGMLLTALALSAGCSDLGVPVGNLMIRGDYGEAQQTIATHMTQDKSTRQYMLDRMRLAIVTMDDGCPQIAQPVFEQVYDLLRTQGLNADKTVASVVINEGVKFWKGEPFEQALAFTYYSMQQASLGHWDNARAAAQNALFHLKDFGKNDRGESLSSQELVERSAAYDRGAPAPGAGTGAGGQKDYLNSGYAVRDSNFVLGYLMNGVANQGLGRDQEAHDNFAVAVQIDRDMAPLVDDLQNSNAYNTVLVVSYGIGPRKVAYGPDRALTRFAPVMPGDRAPLLVWTDSPGQPAGASKAYSVACDVNQMAAELMWNNLEDVRVAKAYIGQFLTAAGIGALGIGAAEHSKEAMLAGLGGLLAGVAVQASAHADTRYCDVVPQRVYLVPVSVRNDRTIIHLQIQGKPVTQMALVGLAPPTDQKIQLRYVRLVGGPYDAGEPPPIWATSGHLYYGNDVSGDTDAGRPIAGAAIPYILEGQSVRAPTTLALQVYNRAGYLSGMTPAELQNLYREEGLRVDDGPVDPAERHVLEGGKTLIPPQAGTAGFMRLFGQLHSPYQPHSVLVRNLAAQLQHTPRVAQLPDAQPPPAP